MTGEPMRPQPKPARRGKKPPKRIPRGKRPNARRTKPRRSGRVRDEARLEWIRTHEVCAVGRYSVDRKWCRYAERDGKPVTDPDHQGPHPMGRKADDDTAVGMCRFHHDARTDGRGYFLGWTKQEMREWCDDRIRETRARYEAFRASQVPPAAGEAASNSADAPHSQGPENVRAPTAGGSNCPW